MSTSDPIEFPNLHGAFLSTGAFLKTHRRHLPHWQQGSAWCFATLRQIDSVPAEKLKQYQAEKTLWHAGHPPPLDDAAKIEYKKRFPQRFEEWVDQGMGSCVFKDPKNAAILSGAIEFFNGRRYRLAAYVVMPNHAHVLFSPAPGHEIRDIVGSWKKFTALRVNKNLGVTGPLWQQECYDTLIRGEVHFNRCVAYIRGNNVEKAKIFEPGAHGFNPF